MPMSDECNRQAREFFDRQDAAMATFRAELQALHGVNLEAEMRGAIGDEIDIEMLDNLIQQANKPQEPEKGVSEEDKYFDRLGI